MPKYYSLQAKQKLLLESGKDKESKGIAVYSSSSVWFWAILCGHKNLQKFKSLREIVWYLHAEFMLPFIF